MIEAYFIGPFGGLSGPRAMRRDDVRFEIEWAISSLHIPPVYSEWGDLDEPVHIRRAVFELVAEGSSTVLYKFREVRP